MLVSVVVSRMHLHFRLILCLTNIYKVINNEYDYVNRAEGQLFLNWYIEIHKEMRMLAAAFDGQYVRER